MIIVNRELFLTLPANTVYVKYGDGPFGDIEIKASGPEDGWGKDWVTDYLTTFCDDPYNGGGCEDMGLPIGTEIRFAADQNCRDGLFEDDQLFCVFDNIDIQRVIDKLQRCIKTDGTELTFNQQ
jgi:hypothetical protein